MKKYEKAGKIAELIAFILLIIGGINWGLWGIWKFNLVNYFFNEMWIENLIYILVGLSAIYMLVVAKKMSCCKSKKHQ
ncbi:MAG: DUF378 domain-containing protein [Parachlamydiales bacterium]|jgi:hypothetical protein